VPRATEDIDLVLAARDLERAVPTPRVPGRTDRIAGMAGRVPAELIEGDRRLAAFVVAARRAGEPGCR
jgi:hypothetical protein